MGEEVLVTEISTGLRIARIKGVSRLSRGEIRADNKGYHRHHLSLAILPYLLTDIDHMPHVDDDSILSTTIISTSWITPSFPQLYSSTT
jgi:hypothetical protein